MRLFSKHVIIEGSLERKAFEMLHSKENGGKVYNVLVRMGSCNVAGNLFQGQDYRKVRLQRVVSGGV